MNAGNDDVEARENLWILVGRAVLVDVALDTGQNAEPRRASSGLITQLFVDRCDLLELLQQSLDGQTVRDG